jgi:hypothetical protein
MSKHTEEENKKAAFDETQELMVKMSEILGDYLSCDKSILNNKSKLLVVSRASNGLIAISNNTIRSYMRNQELYIETNCKQN